MEVKKYIMQFAPISNKNKKNINKKQKKQKRKHLFYFISSKIISSDTFSTKFD